MTPLRRLSDVEAAFARTHALMHGTTQVTTHVTVRGDLDPEHFRRGAERWAAELPLLSLRMEERPDGLWFTTGPGPRPGQIRHDPLGTPESADDDLRGELNDVLETGGPRGGYASSATRARGRRTSTSPATTRSRTATPPVPWSALCWTRCSPRPTGERSRRPDPATQRRRVHDPSTRAAGRPGTGVRAAARAPAVRGAPAVGRTGRGLRPADVHPGGEPGPQVLVPGAEGDGQSVLRGRAGRLVRRGHGPFGGESVHGPSLRRRYGESAELPDVGCFINVLNVPVRVGRGDPVDEARDYAWRWRGRTPRGARPCATTR